VREARARGIQGLVEGLVERADRVQRRHPWLAIPVAVVRKFSDDHGGRWVSLIAFHGFFSLFPLLLVAVTLLGFLIGDDPELQRRILDSALSQFPIIGAQIERNIGALRGSGLQLVLGLVLATWSGMRVIIAVHEAMDEVWGVPGGTRPGFVRSRLNALLVLAVLGTAALGATALSLGAGTWGSEAPVRALSVAGTLLLMTAVLLLVFRLLTTADVSWRDVLPGAVVGALAWEALLLAGAWIVDRQLRNATEVYGFFGIVIGLLGWMTLLATILMYAAELNVVLKRRLWPRSLLQPSLLEPTSHP
jgi:membrane protein